MKWGGKVGNLCQWSELARSEGWKNSEVARSQRWESNEVEICERRRVVSREGALEFKDKIVLHCSRCKQGFTVGIS